MGIDIGRECRRPLRGVFPVPPPGLVCRDIGLSALPERHHLGTFGPLRGAPRPAIVDRVDPVLDHLAEFAGPLTCLGQAQVVKAPEPHFMRSAVEHVSEDPALGPTVADP